MVEMEKNVLLKNLTKIRKGCKKILEDESLLKLILSKEKDSSSGSD